MATIKMLDTQVLNPSASDINEIEALLETDIHPSAMPSLMAMMEYFGADLPDDIEYQAAAVTDAALQSMAFRTSYDEGYCGHFSIPGGDGAAADFDAVFAQDQPFQWIEQHLKFKANTLTQASEHPSELVIFSPGLNTLHDLKPGWEGETTTPQRLEHYVQVLGIPMAQLHLGTDMDQGFAVVPLTPDLQIFLMTHRPVLEANGLMPTIQGEQAILHPRQRDRIETVLSQHGFARPLFQNNLIRILEANETDPRPLVWMAYSRSTSELSGALRTYTEAAISRRLVNNPDLSPEMARQQAEAHLRQWLTVVTVGNADRQWPNGPAYIHYSARSDRPEGGTDPLTQANGVHVDAPDGAGADAVFLHVDGLFSGFDAHNFGAAGAGSLKLILQMNSCQTYRQLWERARAGGLQLPNYRQIAAQVVLTGGDRWLWNPTEAWQGVQLPSPEQARAILLKPN